MVVRGAQVAHVHASQSEVGVVDAEGRIYGTRCGKAMFEWSRPMYRVGATRRRKRHVHAMSSFVVVSRER